MPSSEINIKDLLDDMVYPEVEDKKSQRGKSSKGEVMMSEEQKLSGRRSKSSSDNKNFVEVECDKTDFN